VIGQELQLEKDQQRERPATKLICAISRSMAPIRPERTSTGPARNCTKMLLGSWRRSRARRASSAICACNSA